MEPFNFAIVLVFDSGNADVGVEVGVHIPVNLAVAVFGLIMEQCCGLFLVLGKQ